MAMKSNPSEFMLKKAAQRMMQRAKGEELFSGAADIDNLMKDDVKENVSSKTVKVSLEAVVEAAVAKNKAGKDKKSAAEETRKRRKRITQVVNLSEHMGQVQTLMNEKGLIYVAHAYDEGYLEKLMQPCKSNSLSGSKLENQANLLRATKKLPLFDKSYRSNEEKILKLRVENEDRMSHEQIMDLFLKEEREDYLASRMEAPKDKTAYYFKTQRVLGPPPNLNPPVGAYNSDPHQVRRHKVSALINPVHKTKTRLQQIEEEKHRVQNVDRLEQELYEALGAITPSTSARSSNHDEKERIERDELDGVRTPGSPTQDESDLCDQLMAANRTRRSSLKPSSNMHERELLLSMDGSGLATGSASDMQNPLALRSRRMTGTGNSHRIDFELINERLNEQSEDDTLSSLTQPEEPPAEEKPVRRGFVMPDRKPDEYVFMQGYFPEESENRRVKSVIPFEKYRGHESLAQNVHDRRYRPNYKSVRANVNCIADWSKGPQRFREPRSASAEPMLGLSGVQMSGNERKKAKSPKPSGKLGRKKARQEARLSVSVREVKPHIITWKDKVLENDEINTILSMRGPHMTKREGGNRSSTPLNIVPVSPEISLGQLLPEIRAKKVSQETNLHFSPDYIGRVRDRLTPFHKESRPNMRGPPPRSPSPNGRPGSRVTAMPSLEEVGFRTGSAIAY